MNKSGSVMLGSSKGSRGNSLRFSLRTALLALTLLGVVLASATFYRPITAEVTYRFTVFEAAVLAPHAGDARRIADSDYAWTILSDEELEGARRYEGHPAPVLAKKSRIISSWPRVAETHTYSRPHRIIDKASGQEFVEWQSGSFGGFLGARRAGRRPQLRIEADVTFSCPGKTATVNVPLPNEKISGKLSYEGELPEGNLVFFAPIDDTSYHAIVFKAAINEGRTTRGTGPESR